MKTLVSAIEASRVVTEIRATIIEAASAPIECIVVEKRPAVGHETVVVKNNIVVMPIRSPVVPSPAKPAKEANAKPQAKRDSRSGKEQSGIRIPAWPNPHGRSIHEPGIIL